MLQPLTTFRRGLGAALIALSAVIAFVTTASSAARRAAAASAPRCATPGLVIWQLQFTNLSGRTCALFGYPGVSAVNLPGSQVGSSATRDHARTAHLVTLRNGRTATALLRIVDVGNFPAATCKPVTAAGLRVFPPNSPTSQLVPFPFRACSGTAPTYLFIRVVQR